MTRTSRDAMARRRPEPLRRRLRHVTTGARTEGHIVGADPELETVRVGDVLVCVVKGDLSLDSAPLAASGLERALALGPSVLAVDLAAVELFAPTALDLLLAIRQRALDRGVPLVLIAPSPMTRRVLEVTGAAGLFPVCATAEEAAEQLQDRKRAPGAHGPGPIG